MRFIVCRDYDEVSKKAADFVAAQMTLKPDSNLGLATGSTPIGMYSELASRNIDFSEAVSFNLDEYYPISKFNSQSYYYFMNKHFYSKVNIDPENTHIPDGSADNADAECRAYERMIQDAGDIDLQVLGLGQNGHIGFNEPGSALYSFTHVADLTESTIKANSRFFEDIREVPVKALTMGISTIMRARRILLLASGKEKSYALKALQSGMITPELPVTILTAHSNVTVIADEAAFLG